MNQKIEWYKEVLELEPGSRVFFPLARMQAEEGEPEAALATLRHGLARNPEHLEARLLLIDLLVGGENNDVARPEVDAVSKTLSGYPGFWSAWTERLSVSSGSRDAALALNFLAQSLKGQPISWSEVIEHGLGQLLAQNIAEPAPAARPPVAFDLDEMSALASGLSAAPAARIKPAPAAPAAASPAPAAATDEPALAAGDEEEQFSLKTRSMAEVLAAQGDYAGALDIYEELIAAAKTEEEKTSLGDAIARLTTDLGMPAGVVLTTQEKQEKSQDKGRLLDVLELLADRLESKA